MKHVLICVHAITCHLHYKQTFCTISVMDVSSSPLPTPIRDGIIARELTDEDESHVLIHSLRDANLPKFLAEDVPLFESILDDLFPGVTPPELDQGGLEVIIIIRNNSYKVLFAMLYKDLMTRTTLTYISNKKNLKYCSPSLSPIKR